MTDQRFLIKCDCEECNCPTATTEGVCYECEKGLHVRDREKETLRNKANGSEPWDDGHGDSWPPT